VTDSGTSPCELRCWVLARPSAPGLPAVEDFRLEEAPLRILEPGEVLVRTTYISLDPHIRGQFGGLPGPEAPRPLLEGRMPQLLVGGHIPGYAIGQVIDSRAPGLAPSDAVLGYWGWQTHVIARAEPAVGGAAARTGDLVLNAAQETVTRLDPAQARPPRAALHVLGEMGLTAYVALLEVGKPKPGETVLVSSAAGNVGGIAGQIARLAGCRVVGSVGSPEKAAYITEHLGFDAAVNYRGADVAGQLDRACPDGVDIYFDNVGGAFSDLAIARLREFARVVVCGAIAHWNGADDGRGPRVQRPLVLSRARIEGFDLYDWPDSYDAGLRQLGDWYRAGDLQVRETILDGFERVPEFYAEFLGGAYLGKVLVRVAAEADEAAEGTGG
jgi:NADPH-dependent curcumin reductase CurA